jgi:hypothetical protein
MKNLVNKLFLGAAVVMMGSIISCKDKDKDMNDSDGMDTTVVVDPVTPAPTTTMPADTTGMSSDTTTVTP